MLRISPLIESGNRDRSRSLLVSTNDVIDALGGTQAAARLTGRVKSAPSHWRNRGRFPPGPYLAMTSVLAAKGLFAPAWLWSQELLPPVNSAKAQDGERDDLWSPGVTTPLKSGQDDHRR